MTAAIGFRSDHHNYHDFSGLAALKRDAVQSQSGALEPVARQFEALFLQMMLKSMRSAVPEGGLLDDQNLKFYRDMLDSQLSVDLAERGGIGLADTLVEQLGAHQQGGAADLPATAAAGDALRLQLLGAAKVFPTAADNP